MYIWLLDQLISHVSIGFISRLPVTQTNENNKAYRDALWEVQDPVPLN